MKYGYLDGQFVEHEVRVDLQRYTSSITIVYDTGPQYRFGPVTFQLNVVKPDLL